MRSGLNYLAIDLGASGGRAIVGTLRGNAQVVLREIHRFPNAPVARGAGLYWDAAGLLAQIETSLAKCAAGGVHLHGIGIDTWGVDYALLDQSGELLAQPRHYRDPRTRGMIQLASAAVPPDEIYAATGIQFMELNTLFQLLAEQRDDPDLLARAHTLLFIPNLLNFWLTGVKRAELSIASTSQMFDPQAGRWAVSLIERLGLPARILPEVDRPGTEVGPLRPGIAERTGVGRVPVIAPACHDTASAVAAAPGHGDHWAYISSGTWSLVGVELRHPVCTPRARGANFTNELGVGGRVRFLRNVAGLWLLQECRRVWSEAGREYDYAHLESLARQADPLRTLVDPDDPDFASFGDMPSRIRASATRRGPVPETDAQVVRCIVDSLALKYSQVIEQIGDLTGRPVNAVHLVGGGVQNTLLCQCTADACGLPVYAGPVEATALGNVLVQAMSQGHLAEPEDIRRVVSASQRPSVYEPGQSSAWREAAARRPPHGAP